MIGITNASGGNGGGGDVEELKETLGIVNLPSGYKQISFIESNGLVSIRHYMPDPLNINTFRSVMDANFTSLQKQDVGYSDARCSHFGVYNGMFSLDGGYDVQVADMERHIFDALCNFTDGSMTLTIDNNLSKTRTGRNTPMPFWSYCGIPSAPTQSAASPAFMKIYAVKDYYDDVLVRDMIPAIRESDSAVGLYDLVGDTFYTNDEEEGEFGYEKLLTLPEITGLISKKVQGYYNVWDELWESGYYNDSGQKQADASNIRCVNYLPVMPSTQYYVHITAGYTIRICYYTATYEFISKSPNIPASDGANFETPSNAAYITFYFSTSYGTTYRYDTSINYPASVTEYIPSSKDALWINANPSASFAAQTVAFNLSSYSSVIVIFKESTSYNYYTATVVPTTGYSFRASMNDGSYYYYRDVTANATGVTFGSGYRGSSSSGNYMIPTQIIGLAKKEG